MGSTIRSAAYNLDVGALGLDVAGLLALVADLLAGAGLLGAVAGQMARDTAVVAFVAVDAVTWRTSDTIPLYRNGENLRDMWPMPPQE